MAPSPTSYVYMEILEENLIRCGIDKVRALRFANARQSYWRMAGHQILNEAISNENLSKAGYPCLMDYYRKIAS